MIYCSEPRKIGDDYRVDFALLLNDKPFRFSKISYKGEMLYQNGSGKLAGHFKAYDGLQTESDPTLDAAMGEKAPVYKGYAYAVFNNVPRSIFADAASASFAPYEMEFWP